MNIVWRLDNVQHKNESSNKFGGQAAENRSTRSDLRKERDHSSREQLRRERVRHQNDVDHQSGPQERNHVSGGDYHEHEQLNGPFQFAVGPLERRLEKIVADG